MQRDGDATDSWLQQQSNDQAFSVRLTVFVSVLQDVIRNVFFAKSTAARQLVAKKQEKDFWFD